MLNSLERYAVSIRKPIDEGRTTDRVAHYLYWYQYWYRYKYR